MSVRRFFVSMLFALAGLAPAHALAQFFTDVSNVTVVGPVNCTPTSISSALSGSVTYHLPSGSPNSVLFISLNGVPQLTQTQFITPPTDTIPATNFNLAFAPGATLPYTLVARAFPFENGQPVGTGFQATVNCPAGAPGSLVFTQVSAAPTIVPAMTPPWLLALALLVALAGLAALAHRRAGPG